MPQIDVAVVGAHIVRTQHRLGYRQARLLRELSRCRRRRAQGCCDIRRVGAAGRTNVFVRPTLSAGPPRVGQTHVQVGSVRVSGKATPRRGDVGLRDGAVDGRRGAVRSPLHASAS